MVRWANEDKFDPIIQNAATRYGVPIALVKAVIAAESGFKADAIREEDFSDPGESPPSDWPPGVERDASRGLMQILCWRSRDLGFTGSCDALFDPYTNIALGTRLLAILRARLGKWDGAISAYNGGIRPSLGFGIQLPSGKYRNQDYVDRVVRYWRYFETGEWEEEEGLATAGLVATVAAVVLLFFLVSAAAFQGGASSVGAVKNWQVVASVLGGNGALVVVVVDLRRRVIHLEKTIERCWGKDKG